MRLAFFCGSYEQGKDGVGDYTRFLADALIQSRNYQVAIIALNDTFTPAIINTSADGTSANPALLRLPATLPWPQKTAFAKEWLAAFNPDLLVLQYVCFAFQKKGLPFRLTSHLLAMGGSRRWVVMFHELWVGIVKEASLKHKIWGRMQRYIILQMLSALRPCLVQTQCGLYVANLKKYGWQAQLLPLFSNILVTPPEQLIPSLPGNAVQFILFGTVHAPSTIAAFAEELARYSRENNKKVSITLTGRNGDNLNSFISACKAAGIATSITGEQPSEKVSQLLHQSRFGIATGSALTIEKNGTVAAMWEHGLPVICIGQHRTPIGVSVTIPHQLYEYSPGTLTHHLNTTTKQAPVYGYTRQIADLFTEQMENACSAI